MTYHPLSRFFESRGPFGCPLVQVLLFLRASYIYTVLYIFMSLCLPVFSSFLLFLPSSLRFIPHPPYLEMRISIFSSVGFFPIFPYTFPLDAASKWLKTFQKVWVFQEESFSWVVGFSVLVRSVYLFPRVLFLNG